MDRQKTWYTSTNIIMEHTTIKNPLFAYKKNITSQWGEDGLIEEIFNRIGTSTKLCIEFGAWDGKHFSNTWHLWHNKQWSALLIEGNPEKVTILEETTKAFPAVIPYCAFVTDSGETSLDSICEKCIPEKTIDLLSIDIDSDDFYILESLITQPRVIIIEYNPTIPPSISLVQEKGQYFGSSARAILDLAHTKGYMLAALTETNLILVQRKDFSKLNITEPALEDIFIPDHLTYVFTGYDGTPALSQTPTYHTLNRPTSRTLAFKNTTALNITISTNTQESLYHKIEQKILSFLKQKNKKQEQELTKQAQRVIAWTNSNGDETLRLDYPELTPNSTVVDVGGFKGQWTSDIFGKYQCQVIVFEPVHFFAEKITERFKHNKAVVCYPIGLSDKNESVEISIIEDQSSSFKESKNTELASFVQADSFFKEHGITKIDLLKINIEGGEYALLENLIESGYIKNIKNIQVQFHDFVPQAEERMQAIQKKLNLTHTLTYQFPFVWENWKAKK